MPAEDPIERLNNAIALIDLKAMGDIDTPAGSRKAIHAMAEHWAAWFKTNERWELVSRADLYPASLQKKLEAYARWYGRAYAIASPRVRAQVPTPEQAAPQFAELLAAQRQRWTEGMQDAAKLGMSAAQYAAKGAVELTNAVADKYVGLWQGGGMIALGIGLAFFATRKK